jgi:hypothetical protein
LGHQTNEPWMWQLVYKQVQRVNWGVKPLQQFYGLSMGLPCVSGIFPHTVVPLQLWHMSVEYLIN